MFKHINAQDLADKLKNGDVTVVDIRDQNSYFSGHITSAKPLDNSNVADFIANTDQEQTVVVCCYHGNSSQGAAQYLAEQGFKDVYSLDGGFEVWKVVQPDWVEANV
jgi:thiosulfate sulfurtransferase